MEKIIDHKKPKTGVILNETRFGLKIKWADGVTRVLPRKNLKQTFYGKPRYEIPKD
jgi:hypothetical protein